MTVLVIFVTPFLSDKRGVGVKVTMGEGERADLDRIEAVERERRRRGEKDESCARTRTGSRNVMRVA